MRIVAIFSKWGVVRYFNLGCVGLGTSVVVACGAADFCPVAVLVLNIQVPSRAASTIVLGTD